MSSFLKTVTDILCDKLSVDGVCDRELVAATWTDDKGCCVAGELSPKAVLRVVRLQTVIEMERQRGAEPNLDEIEQDAELTNRNPVQVLDQLLSIQRDCEWRVQILKQLLTEVVREALPNERNQLNVEYYYDMGQGLMRRDRRPMFLD